MGPTSQKNHPLILEIFAELVKRDARFVLLLAGDGPLRASIEQRAAELGIRDKVLMPGLVNDIAALVVNGFDVFLLPSLWEGLPVVGLEALAGGLQVVCSDTITRDFIDTFVGRVTALPLDAPVSRWADAVLEGIRKKSTVEDGIALIDKTPFSIIGSSENLLSVYRKALS
jgi:glycosyltransferase involved in cell wall biosynthesis